MSDEHIKMIADNRKARFNYFIDEAVEAGIVLKGTEVKSLRMGRANIKDAYARIKNGEVFLHQMHIGTYPFSHYDNHEPLRVRKLLLHREEIKRLITKINEKGMSLIPLTVYFRDGKAKVKLGLARGKKKYDKRETIRKRDEQRDLDRQKRDHT